MRTLRFSSHRFVPRNDYTLPELRPTRSRALRRIHLVTARSAPRSGGVYAGSADLRA